MVVFCGGDILRIKRFAVELSKRVVKQERVPVKSRTLTSLNPSSYDRGGRRKKGHMIL